MTKLTRITSKGGFQAPLSERFWRYVSPEPMSGCWLWAGGVVASGYGRLWDKTEGGRTLRAHRVAYQLFNGDVSDDDCVLHACDNPTCVNPAHLFLGSNKDNTHDMVRKGRAGYETRRGTDNKWTKLTPEAVADIRKHEKIARAYAEQYGVKLGAIYAIWHGKSWRDHAAT